MLIYQDQTCKIECINHCFFRLDGGAMFGMIPKKIWSKLIPSDIDNCIRLASRSLLISLHNRKIIIDLGMGNKWSAKLREIYAIENFNLAFDNLGISDIILTHLHLDHAGGISTLENNQPKLTLPTATVHLQADNYHNACNPNIREQGSYLPENTTVLKEAQLNLLNGDCKLFDIIDCYQINGHTLGQQWLKITLANQIIAFPGDLMPTSNHILPHYGMGYDICPATLLKEKTCFTEEAIKNKYLVIFQHDPKIIAGRILRNDHQRLSLYDTIKDDEIPSDSI